MNRSLAIKLTVGALVLGASGFSLPASSHQSDGTWAGSNAMGPMPMMGGGPMGMVGGGMMRGGPVGMMGHAPMQVMQMMRRYQALD